MRFVVTLLLFVLGYPQRLPAQDVTLTASPGNRSVRLTWTAGTDGLLFRLYRQDPEHTHFTHLRSFPATITTFQDPVDAAVEGPFTYFVTQHTQSLDTAFSNQVRLAPNPQGGLPQSEALPPPPPDAVTPALPQSTASTATATQLPLALEPLAWEGPRLNTTSTITFSPDGRQVAVSTMDSVHILAFPSLQPVSHFKVEKKQTPADIQFSPNGNQLAVLSYRDLRRRQKGKMVLWDLETGKQARKEGPPDEGQRLRFSPSGRYLVITAEDKDWALWDLERGKKMKRPFNRFNRVHTVTFSLDEQYIALSYREKQKDQYQEMIAVLAFPSGDIVHEISSPATPCAFSPDGLVLAYGTKVGNRTQMNFLDTVTWTTTKTLDLPHTLPQIVTYSPSGMYLATVALSGVVFRNVTADTLHFSLPGPAPIRMAYPAQPRLLASVNPAGDVAFWKSPETMVSDMALEACTTLAACIDGVRVFPPVRTEVEEQASRLLTSLTEAQTFASFFRSSRYSDQALRLTMSRIPREDVPALLDLYTDSPEVPLLQAAYAQRSQTVAEAVDAAQQFPSVRALAEARAAPLVTDLAEATTFARFFTESTFADAILKRLQPEMQRINIPAFLALFPHSTLVPALQATYVIASPSVADFLEATQRFPGQVPNVETEAARRVRDVPDARAFITAYPQSTLADTLAKHLSIALPRTSLPELVPLFTQSAPVLKQAYLDRSQTPQAYADAALRFPELAPQAEVEAAKLAKDVDGYIAYLMAFPDGQSAQTIRRALDKAPSTCTLQSLSQPENLKAFLAFISHAPEEPNPSPSLFQKPVLGPVDYVEMYLNHLEGDLWTGETVVTDSATQAIATQIQQRSTEIDTYLTIAAPKFKQCTVPRLTYHMTRKPYDIVHEGFPVMASYALDNTATPSDQFFFASMGLDLSQIPLPTDSLFLHVPNRNTADIFARIQAPITGTLTGPVTLTTTRAVIPYKEDGSRSPLILSLGFAEPFPDPLPTMRTQLYSIYPYLQDASTLSR